MAQQKVIPIREKTLEASIETYNQLFGDVGRYISYKLKWRGIHTLTYQMIENQLVGAHVADIGAGYGRFCFLAAQKADKVVGIEMAGGAVEVARILSKSLGLEDRVEILQSTVEDYNCADGSFDIVVLGGVLEHLMDPRSVMEKIHRMLKPGGILISNSPTEDNFRGTISTAFRMLFNFPMALSDVRVVTRGYMEELAKDYGFDLEKSIGVSYERGWGKQAAEDMPKRMENVLQDVKDQVKDFEINKKAFDEWIIDRTAEYRRLLDDWVARGILKEIPGRAEFEYDRSVIEEAGLPMNMIEEFMKADFSMDPYYCDVEPYCHMGGQTIYFLKKK